MIIPPLKNNVAKQCVQQFLKMFSFSVKKDTIYKKIEPSDRIYYLRKCLLFEEMEEIMQTAERKVIIVTSMGKKYVGMIDVPNEEFRTTDLFNSVNVYWKSPNMKCYDDAIFMHDVSLLLDEKAVYKKFDTIQVKLSEIIFFYDEIMEIQNEMEKKRADTVISKAKESGQQITVITSLAANSCYNISGFFFGLFIKKSKDRFIPLTRTNIIEVYKSQGKWFQKKIVLPHDFICFSNSHIESVSIK